MTCYFVFTTETPKQLNRNHKLNLIGIISIRKINQAELEPPRQVALGVCLQNNSFRIKIVARWRNLDSVLQSSSYSRKTTCYKRLSWKMDLVMYSQTKTDQTVHPLLRNGLRGGTMAEVPSPTSPTDCDGASTTPNVGSRYLLLISRRPH